MHTSLLYYSNLFAIDYLKEHSPTTAEFRQIWDNISVDMKKVRKQWYHVLIMCSFFTRSTKRWAGSGNWPPDLPPRLQAIPMLMPTPIRTPMSIPIPTLMSASVPMPTPIDDDGTVNNISTLCAFHPTQPPVLKNNTASSNANTSPNTNANTGD